MQRFACQNSTENRIYQRDMQKQITNVSGTAVYNETFKKQNKSVEKEGNQICILVQNIIYVWESSSEK